MNVIDISNFNFKEEMDKAMNENNAKENICLITHEKLCPLEKITLQCGHSFNYTALICSLFRNRNYSNIRAFNKKISFKCPYCRTVPDKLLPYIPELFSKKLPGINYNDNIDKMDSNLCKYVNKNNNMCGKVCLNGYCTKHYLNSVKIKPTTVKELKLKAKQLKLKNYSKLKKSELLALIEENKNI